MYLAMLGTGVSLLCSARRGEVHTCKPQARAASPKTLGPEGVSPKLRCAAERRARERYSMMEACAASQ